MLVFFLIPFLVGIYVADFSGAGGELVVSKLCETCFSGNGTFQLAARNTGKFIPIAVPLIMIIGLGFAPLIGRKLKKEASFF